MGAVYLDCNATSPLEPAVIDAMLPFWTSDYGNAGSRTHEFGLRAQQAVKAARQQVAAVVAASAEEVVFTSGATESNNLAILGLRAAGEQSRRRHIVSTAIEHKAVLEPLEELGRQGFEITLIAPDESGAVRIEDVLAVVRDDTLLVSVMHANNETGILQPITEIAEGLSTRDAFLHVDAAQGYGKDLGTLRHKRIDLISVSGHKIYGPKGVGCLVVRRRGFKRIPLTPLTFGGGQEGGLRPGTLPVPLIVGLGKASELALREHLARRKVCLDYRQNALSHLKTVGACINGDASKSLPHVLSVSFPGIDSEALMVALKPVAAVSNGSACTSASYRPSHVLSAMRVSDESRRGAIRISWSHLTVGPDWSVVADIISNLQ